MFITLALVMVIYIWGTAIIIREAIRFIKWLCRRGSDKSETTLDL